MSGGSQHNPNGRQSQLGPGWSPLQLQVANLLARAPQAHMADRGVTWHTPTPPPHLYHVPAPSPPDPLQAMKAAGGNSVFRHTATPPELYRHTPTPPDKHLMRHTPSPGDMKASAALPPVELYPHLGPARDKLVRADELLAYARVGVDLSLGGGRAANGAPQSPAGGGPGPTVAGAPALSVRDAPTINSLIARAQPRLPHARVDALLERLAPSPVSPHSVIVHSRVAPTPSPPSSNEDSADSCGAPPGSKRKRKPERTVRMPTVATPPTAGTITAAVNTARLPTAPSPPAPRENGDAPHTEADEPRAPSPPSHARRKTRSGSAETIDDIAAMIAEPTAPPAVPPPVPPAAVTVDKLRSVLAGPTDPAPKHPSPKDHSPKDHSPKNHTPKDPDPEPASAPATSLAPSPAPAAAGTPLVDPLLDPPASNAAAGPAAAPRRRSVCNSNSDAANVPVESPSEAKPAEPEASDARTAEPAAASFVEVENQLEKMFAGLEEEPRASSAGETAAAEASQTDGEAAPANARKRRRSAPNARTTVADRKKPQRKKMDARRMKKGKDASTKDAYDSGSNASSGRSRGPYIQIRGPRASPLSVSVMNAATSGGGGAGEEEETGTSGRRRGEEYRGRARGLHASTLGLRYDATTPDATWLCAFCARGPHAEALGDLFGPYPLDTDCEEYRSLDEATRRRYSTATGSDEAWLHEACGVWAPGLVAAGARLWGLAPAVWAARAQRCAHCHSPPAPLACAARACRLRAHLPCARKNAWTLCEDDFRALCPRHAHSPP